MHLEKSKLQTLLLPFAPAVFIELLVLQEPFYHLLLF